MLKQNLNFIFKLLSLSLEFIYFLLHKFYNILEIFVLKFILFLILLFIYSVILTLRGLKIFVRLLIFVCPHSLRSLISGRIFERSSNYIDFEPRLISTIAIDAQYV